MPRRPHGRGHGRGRLEHARLRALPQRRRPALASRRAGAPAEVARSGHRGGPGRVRGRRTRGCALQRPGRAHPRPAGPPEIQCGAPAPRRRARHAARHGPHVPARARLSGRADRTRGPRRARASLRGDQGALRDLRHAGLRAGAPRRGGGPAGEAPVRPLEGLFVLDFTTLLPGPMATLLLAEAGADVLKIERPGGEEMRHYAPRWGRESVNFALLNRGKKSLALDLKEPAARDRLRPLLERADVLVEQFRPGVMARLGLDYESVSDINPRLVYCSITGYGQTGPKRDVAGHDLNYIGDAGLLALSMGDSARPVVPPALIADIAGGGHPAGLHILLTLRERERTGRGRRLDIAMADSLFPFLYWAVGQGLATGTWPGNGDSLVTGGTPRY